MNSEMFTRTLMLLLISQKCESVKLMEQEVARGNVVRAEATSLEGQKGK